MSMSFFTDELSEVKTHKKEFLEQMNRLIPWGEWVELVKPCYYKGERGNKPYDLELMLRIYVLQMVYNVADMAVAAEVIDSRAFSEFCGVTSSNQVPNGDTIGRFRNILIKNGMQEKLFADVVNRLKARGLMLMKGTIVDSTLISSPSSTKNEKKERDPEAHQVKKGNQWYFGYKGHIGVDRDTGLVNKVKTTAAKVHDVTVVPQLMEGTEEDFHGDSGYLGVDKREDIIQTSNSGNKIMYHVCARPSSLKKAFYRKRLRSRTCSRTRQIFCSLQGGTCFCNRQGFIPIPKDAIARTEKGRRTTAHALRFSEPHFGCPAFRGSLSGVRLKAKRLRCVVLFVASGGCSIVYRYYAVLP